MSKPHGFKKNIKIKPNSFGYERREDWLDDIANNSGFQPIGIYLKDIDQAFVDMVKTDLKIETEIYKDDKPQIQTIPVIFLTAQRWAEFSKTWEFTNELKEISLPFMTIVRKPEVQVGTGQNGFYNIPGRQSWIYHKVPTFEGGRKGIDLYKIPQPTSVDVSFEVRIFTSKLTDLNKANEVISIAFDSIQKYIKVKGHPMPVKLLGNNDESTLNDFQNRRMYINMYDMVIQAYILDEKEFEVVSTIDRAVVVTETVTKKANRIKYKPVSKNTFIYEFLLYCDNNNSFTFINSQDSKFTLLTNKVNIQSYEILINGNPVTLPTLVNNGDNVTINFIRNNPNSNSAFNILGEYE